MIMIQKAKAAFFVGDPAMGTDISADLLPMGSSYQLIPLFKQQFNFTLNAYVITRETADLLLSRSDVTLKQLQDSIALEKNRHRF